MHLGLPSSTAGLRGETATKQNETSPAILHKTKQNKAVAFGPCQCRPRPTPSPQTINKTKKKKAKTMARIIGHRPRLPLENSEGGVRQPRSRSRPRAARRFHAHSPDPAAPRRRCRLQESRRRRAPWRAAEGIWMRAAPAGRRDPRRSAAPGRRASEGAAPRTSCPLPRIAWLGTARARMPACRRRQPRLRTGRPRPVELREPSRERRPAPTRLPRMAAARGQG